MICCGFHLHVTDCMSTLPNLYTTKLIFMTRLLTVTKYLCCLCCNSRIKQIYLNFCQRELFYSVLETICISTPSIAAIVSLLLTSDRKSSRCKLNIINFRTFSPVIKMFFTFLNYNVLLVALLTLLKEDIYQCFRQPGLAQMGRITLHFKTNRF